MPNPCPPGMVPVSGGAFQRGAGLEELDLASMGVSLGFIPLAPEWTEVGDFCMDVYEYPNRAGVRPVSNITFVQAQSACLSEGKRLCTEREFDRACGGLEGWHHPYGPFYLPGMCNTEVQEGLGETRWIAPSGSFFECKTPEGIFDLDGNLSEWVDVSVPMFPPSDFLGAPAPLPPVLDLENGDPLAVVRGGTMWVAIYGTGCQARHLHAELGPTSEDDGFRCCVTQACELPEVLRPGGSELTAGGGERTPGVGTPMRGGRKKTAADRGIAGGHAGE